MIRSLFRASRPMDLLAGSATPPVQRNHVLLEAASPDVSGMVRTSLPDVTELQDAIFVPKLRPGHWDDDTGWGVYRSDGALCEAAAYRRYPHGQLVGQSPKTDRLRDLPQLDGARFIYGGPAYPHYGHMLVTTLARLWARPRGSPVKILMHGDGGPGHWFAHPSFAQTMSALGVEPEDIVFPTEAMRVGELTVPFPSFEELRSAHVVHGELAAAAASALVGASPPTRKGSPIYLSKSRLHSGVRQAVGEEVMEAEFESAGVRVLYPETMTLAEQIAAIESASVVMGIAGSALHGVLFARCPVKLRAMSADGENIYKLNFHLIDMIKDVEARYFKMDAAERLGAGDSFGERHVLTQPVETARAFLEASL